MMKYGSLVPRTEVGRNAYNGVVRELLEVGYRWIARDQDEVTEIWEGPDTTHESVWPRHRACVRLTEGLSDSPVHVEVYETHGFTYSGPALKRTPARH